MSQIALFIRHHAKPGRRDDLRRLWETRVRAYVSAEPGQLVYAYCEDATDPDVILVFQLHTDATVAASFTRQPWYAAYHSGTEDLLVAPSQFWQADPIWTKPQT